jgi:cell division cycle 14
MPPSKPFPRPVAVFNDRFIFTTLTEKEVTQAALVPFHHPTTLKSCSLFTCKCIPCR